MSFAFPKYLRLLSPPEFRRVMAARTSASQGPLQIFATTNDLDHPRLGLTVSRKVGSAVARNRWKRLLREAFRLSQHRLPPLDYVCVPRGATIPELNQLLAVLPALAERLAKRLAARRHEETP